MARSKSQTARDTFDLDNSTREEDVVTKIVVAFAGLFALNWCMQIADWLGDAFNGDPYYQFSGTAEKSWLYKASVGLFSRQLSGKAKG